MVQPWYIKAPKNSTVSHDVSFTFTFTITITITITIYICIARLYSAALGHLTALQTVKHKNRTIKTVKKINTSQTNIFVSLFTNFLFVWSFPSMIDE